MPSASKVSLWPLSSLAVNMRGGLKNIAVRRVQCDETTAEAQVALLGWFIIGEDQPPCSDVALWPYGWQCPCNYENADHLADKHVAAKQPGVVH